METPQGETLVWKGHPSWRAMLLFYVKWTIIALIPAAIYVALQAAGQDSSVTWLGGATVIALVLVYVIGWVLRRTTRYLVTDRRISIRTGLFARNERTMHVDRIQNVNMSQNFFQRLLGIGDVDWDTAGTGVGGCRVQVPRHRRSVRAGAARRRIPLAAARPGPHDVRSARPAERGGVARNPPPPGRRGVERQRHQPPPLPRRRRRRAGAGRAVPPASRR